MIPIEHVILLSAILFGIGTVGVLVRRNLIAIFMSIELMLNAANLAFVGFARQYGSDGAHAVVLFVVVLAAVEAAGGFAIVIAMFRNRGTVNADEVNLMKG